MTIQSFNFSPPKRLDGENIPTLDKLLEYLDSLAVPADVRDKLKARARPMPPGSYRHFIININHHIQAVTENGNTSNS